MQVYEKNISQNKDEAESQVNENTETEEDFLLDVCPYSSDPDVCDSCQ